jgi:hypothetical protein
MCNAETGPDGRNNVRERQRDTQGCWLSLTCRTGAAPLGAGRAFGAAAFVGMDSLLYVGGADDNDTDDEDEDDEGVDVAEAEEAKAAAAAASAPKPVDFAALQRAGYATSSLTSTDTYARLTKEEEETKEEEKKEREREDREKFDARVAEEEARNNLLDKKKIDAKIGYKKRFDETHEDFRSKEKRKRSLGQQNRDGNWVEEEKRALRHSGANFDS